jgi:hypothetical protein
MSRFRARSRHSLHGASGSWAPADRRASAFSSTLSVLISLLPLARFSVVCLSSHRDTIRALQSTSPEFLGDVNFYRLDPQARSLALQLLSPGAGKGAYLG